MTLPDKWTIRSALYALIVVAVLLELPLSAQGQPEALEQSTATLDAARAWLNQQDAISRDRSAAEGGDADAQVRLGLSYSGGDGVRQDHAEAARWYRLAAEQGHGAAQVMLGASYASGHGVPLDQTKAAQWFLLAAEQGNAAAQYQIGRCYHAGSGVQRDLVEAARWYRLAAEQGEVNAQLKLGALYSLGKGVPQDHEESVRWYRLAALQGHADGQHALGFAYSQGHGVRKDEVEAAKWIRLAATQGNTVAQMALGAMYMGGRAWRSEGPHAGPHVAQYRQRERTGRGPRVSRRRRVRVDANRDCPRNQTGSRVPGFGLRSLRVEMTKPFDLLAELAPFSRERGMSLRDPETVPAFVRYAGAEARRALDDETLLHGHRASNLDLGISPRNARSKPESNGQ